MAASDRPQIGGAPRGSARSLRLRAAAVNRLEIPLGSMTGPDRAIPRSSGALPGASWGGTLPLAAGRCLPGEDSTQRRPRLRHSELWARSFLDLGALPGLAACEISGRPRRDSPREGSSTEDSGTKGGSAFGPQDAGPPSASRGQGKSFHLHARIRTIAGAHEGLSDRPSDSERTTEAGGPASVP